MSVSKVVSEMPEETKYNQSKWLCCPICGAKTRTKVLDSTIMIDFPLFCRKCKKEIIITLVAKRISYQENNNEPDR